MSPPTFCIFSGSTLINFLTLEHSPKGQQGVLHVRRYFHGNCICPFKPTLPSGVQNATEFEEEMCSLFTWLATADTSKLTSEACPICPEVKCFETNVKYLVQSISEYKNVPT